MPVYNFDPTESDDWENNLLEEEFSLRSKEKEKVSIIIIWYTLYIYIKFKRAVYKINTSNLEQ